MAYEIGELDQRIELQRAQSTPDGAGGSTESWSTYATVWALVRPMSGRERQAAARAEATADHLVVIRNRSDLLESDRILWRGRHLNVAFIKSRGPGALFLELEAELGAQS